MRGIMEIIWGIRCLLSFLPGDLPEAGDIRINELLYEAIPSDAEYIELYNCSSGEIPLKEIYLAKRNAAGELSALKRVTDSGRMLEPGGLVWICSRPEAVEAAYVYHNPANCVVVPTKLAYADGGGTVVVVNARKEVLDELTYGKFMHNSLLRETKGVALECVRFADGTYKWTSAGGDEQSGYGSPGMPNRAGRIAEEGSEGRFSCGPEVFTPDGDGREDFLEIVVSEPEKEFVLHLLVYDSRGRPVRKVAGGVPGYGTVSYRWDGTGETGRLMPAGIYVVYVRIVQPDGRCLEKRKVCVLSR